MYGTVLQHEGMPTTKGTRIILVGFLHVERIDPLHVASAGSSTSNGSDSTAGTAITGLSWLASWGSLPWMHTTFKQGMHASYGRLASRRGQGEDDGRLHIQNNEPSDGIGKGGWKDSKWARGLFHDLTMTTQSLLTSLCPLHKMQLVAPGNRTQYLEALDAYHETQISKSINSISRARWFEGQQIETDVDGSLYAKYDSRAAIEEQLKAQQS
jgi:hypothetical protein